MVNIELEKGILGKIIIFPYLLAESLDKGLKTEYFLNTNTLNLLYLIATDQRVPSLGATDDRLSYSLFARPYLLYRLAHRHRYRPLHANQR